MHDQGEMVKVKSSWRAAGGDRWRIAPFGQRGTDRGAAALAVTGLAAPAIARAAEEEEDQRKAARRPDRRLDRAARCQPYWPISQLPISGKMATAIDAPHRVMAKGQGARDASNRVATALVQIVACTGSWRAPAAPRVDTIGQGCRRRAQQGKGATGQQHADQSERCAAPNRSTIRPIGTEKTAWDQGGQGQAPVTCVRVQPTGR